MIVLYTKMGMEVPLSPNDSAGSNGRWVVPIPTGLEVVQLSF